MRRLKLTEILVIINVSVYVVLAILSFNPLVISTSILIWVAQYNYFVIYHFFYYQFISSIFVHLTLAHIMSNSLVLLLIGYRCEELFSVRDYLLIYLLSGISGNLLSLLLGLYTISGGASGAIFGIYAATLYAISVKERTAFKNYLFIGIIFLILSGVQPGVNPFSHWFGFITGLLLGWYLYKKASSKQLKRIFAKFYQ